MMSNQLLDKFSKLTFTKIQLRRNYFFSSIKVVDVLGMLTVSLVRVEPFRIKSKQLTKWTEFKARYLLNPFIK